MTENDIKSRVREVAEDFPVCNLALDLLDSKDEEIRILKSIISSRDGTIETIAKMLTASEQRRERDRADVTRVRIDAYEHFAQRLLYTKSTMDRRIISATRVNNILKKLIEESEYYGNIGSSRRNSANCL